ASRAVHSCWTACLSHISRRSLSHWGLSHWQKIIPLGRLSHWEDFLYLLGRVGWKVGIETSYGTYQQVKCRFYVCTFKTARLEKPDSPTSKCVNVSTGSMYTLRGANHHRSSAVFLSCCSPSAILLLSPENRCA